MVTKIPDKILKLLPSCFGNYTGTRKCVDCCYNMYPQCIRRTKKVIG